MIELAFGLSCLAVVIGAVGAIARLRVRQLDNQAMCREEFFAAADTLVGDPETPERIVDEMERFAAFLASRTVLWRFTRRLLLGELRGDPSQARQEYLSAPPHLRRPLVVAWVSGLFALTFNNLILGGILRRVLLWSVSRRPVDFDAAAAAGPLVDEFAHNKTSSAAA